jgi:hypothetical protein
MVHVSIDDGATWQAAHLEPPHGREWQRFFNTGDADLSRQTGTRRAR